MTDNQALKAIAQNVQRLRADRSKSWLARETDTYPIQITRIERQENMPGAGLLSRLAEALDVNIADLLRE